MANQKITDLTEKVTIAGDDLHEIVDSVTGTNKKVKSTTILLQVNTWFVNPSASGGDGTAKNPYTVNEAMAAASEGDIIFFQPGEYTSDITVTKDNLTFVGYEVDVCKITVTNFVIDTDAQSITLILKNLLITTSNDLIQGTNPAIIIFRNVIGVFPAIIIYRILIYGGRISTSGNITTSSFTTVRNAKMQCTTWTIDGTSSFEKTTISGNISAAGRTLTFNTCDITGDVNCANLTYKNTVITGTKVGTSSTTINNQEVTFSELSANPSDPAEGNSIMWQSDGTGSGDDGDIMMKITAGGTTKTTTIVDFSTI